MARADSTVVPLEYTESRPAHALSGLLRDDVALRNARAGDDRPELGAGEGLVIEGADDPSADSLKRGLRAWGHISGARPSGGRGVWVGGREVVTRVARCDAPMPTVISFYTVGTPYEEEAAGLIACCERLGLAHDVRGVTPRGSWEANCAMKGAFVRDRWRESTHGVVWIDADARIAREPTLFRANGVDFAVHRCAGWQFASGTACFWKTPAAGVLLDDWVELCENDPRQWDQVSLDLAWERTVRGDDVSLRTLWLPQTYTKIFDHGAEDPSDADPVIVHHQASRRFKRAVAAPGSGPSTAIPTGDDELMAARRACRPRPAA